MARWFSRCPVPANDRGNGGFIGGPHRRKRPSGRGAGRRELEDSHERLHAYRGRLLRLVPIRGALSRQHLVCRLLLERKNCSIARREVEKRSLGTHFGTSLVG